MEEKTLELQPVETSAQPEAQDQSSVSKKQRRPWLKIILFSLLGLSFAAGLVFAGIQIGRRKGQPRLVEKPTVTSFITPSPSYIPEEKASITPSLTPIPEEKVSYTKDKIFFVEGKNIFMMDKHGANKLQITNFPVTDFNSPQDVQVINDEYLGFYKCDTMTGDFNCGIYRVSVVSKQIEKILKEDADKLILQLAWRDGNTFAYTVSGVSAENWWIYLFKEGEKKTIEEIKGESYGRGGFIEDSSKLAFSPNGTKIIQIATSSPRIGTGGMDFNVYIFDLNGDQLAKIEKATQPAWLDNNTIIFRRQGEGFFSFDVLSETEKKYEEISDKAYSPKVLKGSSRVLYWVNEGNGQVWLFNPSVNTSEMLLDNASDPLWVSGSEILVSDNKECVAENGPCMWRNFTPISVSIFDLSARSKNKLFDSEIGGGNIFYDVTYYNSHWTD